MDPYFAAFGAHVKDLRLERGLTQEEAAARANVHVTYLSGIERGRRNPSLGSIRRIATALSVSVSELLSFEEPEG